MRGHDIDEQLAAKYPNDPTDPPVAWSEDGKVWNC
jgi:hypothetical protein